jgi:phosphatidylinositol alpha-1,6-mannosyltransferase
MKSLLISSADFPPQTGGISRTMGTLASALGPHEVCCLTAVPSNADDAEATVGVKVYRRPKAFAKSRAVQTPGFCAAIAEIMLREKPQLAQLATAYDGYMGLWMQRWLKLPFVIYAHGNEILDALGSPWPKPRLSLIKAARVLANSRFTAKLVEKAGADPARIEVVHAACDVQRFRPVSPGPRLCGELLGSGERKPVLLSVGRLVERKGHDMVIAALPQLIKSFPNVVYLIVGEGPYWPELEAISSARGVRDRVTFAGRISDDDLPEVYALSDVFVMPSRERIESGDVEGFGLVYLEANACAKPVVGGRSGGVPDAVIDGVTGLLVDPLSAQEVAIAINRVLSSPDLAARLGNQGRDRVLQEFTWPRFVDRIRRICDQVVTEAGARG